MGAEALAGQGVTFEARAKINLALHVTGRRADGYHLLDSLVCFAATGDLLRLRAAEGLSLAISGPMARGLEAGPSNLVWRAAALMGGGVAIELEKHLPLASGIGGGSADAAATLRAMAALTGRALPGSEAVLALGADVPVCLSGQPVRMQGIGEILTPLALPAAWLVLVNPGLAVATPEVFRALARKENPPLPAIPEFRDLGGLVDWLGGTRNDLQPAALEVQPGIAPVLEGLAATEGCLLARMSGSGATCFGLFASEAAARAAATGLSRPGWWVVAAALA